MLNPTALEPLFLPWEEPNAHRVKAKRSGEPAEIVKGRRPSSIAIAHNLRGAVREWRKAFYAGASDTSRYLLQHWFERSHRGQTAAGEEFEFRYYFCQREAVETLIYLKEVRGLNVLSQITAEFGGAEREVAALGITEEEDAWSRYAFKLATGAGKTKVMSLAIVWSYFHAHRESESEMAKHFVVIAPNLTVYERLKEDFGDGKVFDKDPLIPPEWRGDGFPSVVLQDEAGGAATEWTIYLTNIHRLYDTSKRKKREGETYSFMGPPVSRTSALDTGQALRDRITGHKRVMVLNDEAHHVWDPDSAWNEAIEFLHNTIASRTGGGLVAQLDFSATPKDNKGQPFKHIVCDAPLGEAVDGGIVKTPIIGKASAKLDTIDVDDASYRYERHLHLGYDRWKASRDEWQKSGKKALLFVMCEDTKAADDIARRLNTDGAFKELNGKTINLHTNLKGKLKKIGRGNDAEIVFIENEKEIDDEDLKALRKLSRELDSNTSPYSCIVSVLMLREGWDVRNVTTIVPLRPYTSKANILPEQTLGRGLRRITPPGQAHEIVTVVDHPAFASFYQEELAQEGLAIEVVELDKVPSTTISIFPDPKKDLQALEVAVPALTPGHQIVPKLEGLTIEDVRKAFAKYKPLPLGGPVSTTIDYEGRHLFTGEIIEKMKIDLPLLQSGAGAVSYYVRQLEHICRLRGLHAALAPLIQTFLEEILFEQKTNLYDQGLISRLGDSDVGEHVRAVFIPLIRARTTHVKQVMPAGDAVRLSQWKPFQVTHNERRPALVASKTLFNLAPCGNALEEAMAQFVNHAPDVAAFAKNAGPQALRIDYLAAGGRLSFYTPDFFLRATNRIHFLVETKGRADRDVPRKARAAIAWCKAASTPDAEWRYLYVPQGTFEKLSGETLEALVRTCAPALQEVIEEETRQAEMPLFATVTLEERPPEVTEFVAAGVLEALPPRYKAAVEQAVMLFRFLEKKPGVGFAPVFTALLGSVDEAAKGLLARRLDPDLPPRPPEQQNWFDPYYGKADPRRYLDLARNLKKTLVFRNGISPLGLLRNCMDYALNDNNKIGGVFAAIKAKFQVKGGRDLLGTVTEINDFRNTYVAHQEKELTDAKLAEKHLHKWIQGLRTITTA